MGSNGSDDVADDDPTDRETTVDGSSGTPDDPASGTTAPDATTRELDRIETALQEIREDLVDLEDEVEGRTVHRDAIEADLRRYVRRRIRRGHARGWGPYLVLLYGTAMTIGAFYLLSGGWAILAMLVVWLSTLGLYALMILVGLVLEVLGLPGRALDRIRDRRE